jgi:hypothetical protein
MPREEVGVQEMVMAGTKGGDKNGKFQQETDV